MSIGKGSIQRAAKKANNLDAPKTTKETDVTPVSASSKEVATKVEHREWKHEELPVYLL